MPRRLAPLLALAAIVLPAAGCGDDSDDTSTTSTTALSKADFVREANKICKRTDDKIRRASQQFFADAPPNQEAPPDEIAEFGKKTVFPSLQDEIDRVRALGAPEGDEDQVKEILDAAQEGLDKLENDPTQLAKGGAAPAFEKYQKLAGAYGLNECAAG